MSCSARWNGDSQPPCEHAQWLLLTASASTTIHGGALLAARRGFNLPRTVARGRQSRKRRHWYVEPRARPAAASPARHSVRCCRRARRGSTRGRVNVRSEMPRDRGSARSCCEGPGTQLSWTPSRTGVPPLQARPCRDALAFCSHATTPTGPMLRQGHVVPRHLRYYDPIRQSLCRASPSYCTTTGDRLLFSTTETPAPICADQGQGDPMAGLRQGLDRDAWWSIVYWEHKRPISCDRRACNRARPRCHDAAIRAAWPSSSSRRGAAALWMIASCAICSAMRAILFPCALSTPLCGTSPTRPPRHR
jgi:hypothetical protein